MQNSSKLECLRHAAEIHKQVREYIRPYIKPNVKLFDICNLLENKTRELTRFNRNNPLIGGIAFPTGLSINNCAAHWTPNPGDNNITLKYDDVCKVDFGVHINGYIIDSAFTISFNDKYDKLLEAAKEATFTGIKHAGVDSIIGEIGEHIQEVIESYEIEIDQKIYSLKSIGALCGHSIDQYKIHSGKVIPNIKFNYPVRMKEGEVYAVETFPSTGSGHVIEDSDCSHYMINYLENTPTESLKGKDKYLYNIIQKNYGTLAFCKRWLNDLNLPKYQINLSNLVKQNIVMKYPPLIDVKGSYVAQFEHTIYIGEKKVEVLTDSGET